jgi:hypothetical protein
MDPNNKERSVVVFEGTTWEAAVVKSLLENADLQAFLKDDIYGTLAPWVTSPGGAGPVKVVISGADIEKARQVVEDYEKNKNS